MGTIIGYKLSEMAFLAMYYEYKQNMPYSIEFTFQEFIEIHRPSTPLKNLLSKTTFHLKKTFRCQLKEKLTFQILSCLSLMRNWKRV